MLGNRDTNGTWQLIGSTFYIVLERLVDIQLRIQVAGNNIQHVRRFIASVGRLRAINIGSTLTFYRNGDSFYQNGNGYGSYSNAYGDTTDLYADGSYSVTEGNTIYHFDRFGNLTGVQVFNGSWYETVWGC